MVAAINERVPRDRDGKRCLRPRASVVRSIGSVGVWDYSPHLNKKDIDNRNIVIWMTVDEVDNVRYL